MNIDQRILNTESVLHSIWRGVGFHFMFVYINRLVGIEPGSIIQFSNMTNEGPVQVILIGCLLLVFIALLLYPRLSGKRIEWKVS